MPIEIRVPAVGESVREVQIVEWHVAEGEWIERDRDLVEIDTEKATVQIPAPASGTVAKILAAAGVVVNVGDVIGQIEESARPAAPAPSASPAEAPAATAPDEGNGSQPPRIMPAAARALAEHRLAPADVTPSGPGGRLLKEDVDLVVQASRLSSPSEQPAVVQPPRPQSTEQPAAERPHAAVPEAHLGPAPAAPPGSSPSAGPSLPATRAPRRRPGAYPRTAPARLDGRKVRKRQPVYESTQKRLPPRQPAAAPPSEDREEEIVPMSLIRRRIARAAGRGPAARRPCSPPSTKSTCRPSWRCARSTRDAFQQKYGVKLGFMSFFVKAVDRRPEAVPAGQRRDPRPATSSITTTTTSASPSAAARGWSCPCCATPSA